MMHSGQVGATLAVDSRLDRLAAIAGELDDGDLVVRDVSREVGELAVVLNKVDQVLPDQLREVMAFTRETIATAIDRPVERFFSVSALERLTNKAATREWSPFESYLRALSGTARERLVSHAGARAVKRCPQSGARGRAAPGCTTTPLAELEARVAGLRRALVDLDRSLIQLRFRFDAAEANLGRRFELQRMQFIGDASRLHEHLHAWIDVQTA